MAEINLNARLRHESGKGAAHRLRAAGVIPGVFYLGSQENLPVEVDAHELQTVLKQKPQLVILKLDDGTEHECVIRELQFDPITGRHQHIDFMGIVRGRKVTVKVNVLLTGSAFGVRTQGGVLQHSIHALSVECLPKDIPERVAVDISELKVGSSIHVRDLQLENVRILDEPHSAIVTVLAPRIEKVAEEVVAEEAVEGEEAEAEAEEGEEESEEK